MNLDLKLLNTFLQIADAGSFSAAARLHGLSQPTLSRQIQQLEDKLGHRIFDRDTRNLSLTPVGNELYALATRLLGDFNRSFEQLDEFATGLKGRVVIIAIPTMAATLVPAAIATFSKTRPNVIVELREDFTKQVADVVANGEAELGLSITPSLNKDLRFTPLMKDRFFAAAADGVFSAGDEISWSDLAEQPFIAFDRQSSIRMMADRAFSEANAVVQIQHECRELATVGGFLAAGLGVTALPELTLPHLARQVVCRELIEPRIYRTLGLVTSLRRVLSPAALAFAECLKKEAHSSPWRYQTNLPDTN